MRPRCLFPSLLAAALLAAPAARADTVILTADRDCTLIEIDDGSLGNGSGEFIFAGNTGQADDANSRRALLHFDIDSAIPDGATIYTATLSLYLSRSVQSSPATTTLHLLIDNWGEGASNPGGQEGAGTLAELNDATWLHTFYNPADPPASPGWKLPGGDFDLTPSATTSVGDTLGFYTWTSTLMADDVQLWLDNPAANFGWILLGDESSQPSAKRFNSRTNGTVSRRPTLTIDFAPPCPQDIAPSGGDGHVTIADINSVISSFGLPCVSCPQDIMPLPNGDNAVTIADITAVITAFGPCP